MKGVIHAIVADVVAVGRDEHGKDLLVVHHVKDLSLVDHHEDRVHDGKPMLKVVVRIVAVVDRDLFEKRVDVVFVEQEIVDELESSEDVELWCDVA